MVQVVKVTGKKHKTVSVPKWLSHPVSGKEAQKRAQEYDKQMKKISEGHGAPQS